jgi:hypothetical protein
MLLGMMPTIKQKKIYPQLDPHSNYNMQNKHTNEENMI